MWIEHLLELWRDLPLIIRWPMEFGFTVIFLRGIVANEITKELKERGLVKEGFFRRSLHWLASFIPNRDRLAAIWEHYAREQHAGDVVVCEQGRCSVIG